MMEPLQIGWHNLPEDSLMVNNTFQYAADFEELHVKAGRYPIVVYEPRIETDGRLTSATPCGAYILYEGTAVRSSYANSIGKPSSYHPFYYMFQLADAVAANPDEFQLFPEYRVRKSGFASRYDGRTIVTHDIYKKEASI